eukprot:s111_g18.t1
MATVPVSFGTQKPEVSTFYGSFSDEVKTFYPSRPSRGSFMPPSPPPPAPRARSRPRHDMAPAVSSRSEPLPPLAQPKGDVAPMEPHHPLRPMKSLAPPGRIAAGIPWLDYGPGCMPLAASPRHCAGHNGWQRPPSPLPMGSHARSISPSPLSPGPLSPRRVVILHSSVAPTTITTRPLQSAPLPILPSSARSVTRMTTIPSRPPPVRTVRRSMSPEPATRAPSPDLRALRAPGVAGSLHPELTRLAEMRSAIEEERKQWDAKIPSPALELDRRRWEDCRGVGGSSDVSTDVSMPPLGLPSQNCQIFRRKLFSQELAQIQRLLEDKADLRAAAAQEFRWALHSGGRCGDDTIDTAAALSALRQLAYLYGLPALDADAARQCFGPSVDFDSFASALPTLLHRAQDSSH